MTERQLQFRVGLFVLTALGIGAFLIFQFSDVRQYWDETYALAIHFEDAGGVQVGTPVKQNGIDIGQVREVVLADEGGVLVIVEIRQNVKLRIDAEPVLSTSLFGETKVQFTSGVSSEIIPPNSKLVGVSPTNPMEIVQRLELSLNKSLTTFTETSSEWQRVGENVNRLLSTKEGQLDEVIAQSADSLRRFNVTMEAATRAFEQAGRTLETASGTLTNANALLADPQMQKDLRQMASALPKIAEETRLTIATARNSIQQVNANLETINAATTPIAEESELIVRKLSGSLIQLESLLTELNQFSKVLNTENGSIQQLTKDPTLYRNLSRSSAELNVLLGNLKPIIDDARIFSDRIARHPELLGVSGAMRGSSGLKTEEEIQQTGFSTPSTLPR